MTRKEQRADNMASRPFGDPRALRHGLPVLGDRDRESVALLVQHRLTELNGIGNR